MHGPEHGPQTERLTACIHEKKHTVVDSYSHGIRTRGPCTMDDDFVTITSDKSHSSFVTIAKKVGESIVISSYHPMMMMLIASAYLSSQLIPFTVVACRAGIGD